MRMEHPHTHPRRGPFRDIDEPAQAQLKDVSYDTSKIDRLAEFTAIGFLMQRI